MEARNDKNIGDLEICVRPGWLINPKATATVTVAFHQKNYIIDGVSQAGMLLREFQIQNLHKLIRLGIKFNFVVIWPLFKLYECQ